MQFYLDSVWMSDITKVKEVEITRLNPEFGVCEKLLIDISNEEDIFPYLEILLVVKQNGAYELVIGFENETPMYLLPMDFDLYRGKTLRYCVVKYTLMALASIREVNCFLIGDLI